SAIAIHGAELVWLLRKKKKGILKHILLVRAVERPLVPRVCFQLSTSTDAHLLIDFRFNRERIKRLTVLLRSPDVVATDDGDRIGSAEAMCVGLNTLAYPTRFVVQSRRFGRSAAALCRIFLFVLNAIHDRWNQRLYFSIEACQRRILSTHLVAPYKSANLSERQCEVNRAMSSVRESVEWSFGRLKTLWAMVDCGKKHKVMLSPVRKIVKVAMLLTNCHCCWNDGNQISEFFGVHPLSLEDWTLSLVVSLPAQSLVRSTPSCLLGIATSSFSSQALCARDEYALCGPPRAAFADAHARVHVLRVVAGTARPASFNSSRAISST
ncbi:hypothetical protein PybrP1_001937, partial [[Pythium] brassicae (nom. inval.)]